MIDKQHGNLINIGRKTLETVVRPPDSGYFFGGIVSKSGKNINSSLTILERVSYRFKVMKL